MCSSEKLLNPNLWSKKKLTKVDSSLEKEVAKKRNVEEVNFRILSSLC